MPFAAAIPFIAGGAAGGLTALFGKKKKQEDPYAKFLEDLKPYLDANKEITTKASEAGLANISAARNDYDCVNNFLKEILTSSDDNILKMFDTASATRNIDENEQQLSELGVRGGRRAANLGQSYFNRDAAIDRILKQIRFAAPGQIANIGQAIGNLGLGELSASTGAGAQASNVILGVQGLEQQDKDRRNALIGSIFEAIGSAAGIFAG